MLVHCIRPATAAANNTLLHRSSSAAPGKEAGSRTEFASDKNAADIHVHAYASVRTAVQRKAKRLATATVHGN